MTAEQLEARRREWQALLPERTIIIDKDGDVGYHLPIEEGCGGCVGTGERYPIFVILGTPTKEK